MSKSLILSACFAVAAIFGQAQAADGVISSDTLSDMGLEGATVVSDSAAAEVRGMGYEPSRRSVTPKSKAWGSSWARVGDRKSGAAAATENGYSARGPYGASGENFSEAGRKYTHRKVVNINGVKKSIKTTKSINVYAGGYSSSLSF